MNRNRVSPGPASLAVAILLVLAACGPQAVDLPGSVFNPTQTFVAAVTRDATALAQAEIAKFNAAEEQYKTVVSLEYNPVNPNPFREGIGTYMKWYRHFTSARIVDIKRSESLIHPMLIVIAYDCEMMATNGSDEDSKDTFLNIDPVKNAEKETQFNLLRTVTFTRNYPCEAFGKYIGGLPEVPDRGSFYLQGDEIEAFMARK